MLKLFSFPYSDHPLFRIENRSLSRKRLARASVLIAVLVSLVVGILWLTAVLTAPYVYGNRDYAGRSQDFIVTAFFLSLAADLLIDFGSLSLTATAFDMQQNPAWWDLIRVTILPPETVVAVKHAAAQLHVWRLMMAIVGARLSVIFIFFLHLTLIAVPESTTFFNPLMLVPAGIVLTGLYIIEPYWRMWAMTAFGLSLSARARNSGRALFRGIGSLLPIWITQVLLMVPLIATLLVVTIVFVFLWFCGLLLASVVVVYAVRLYYQTFSDQWLHTASRHLSTEG